MMKKSMSILTLAGVVTFALFALMAFIVKNDQILPPDVSDYFPVEIAKLPEEKPPVVKPPVKLTPPPRPKPVPRDFEQPVTESANNEFDYQPSRLNLTGGKTILTMNNNRSDNEARPIVRINPKYPIAAMRDGIEGWVKLRFNINEIGAVTDIKVIDADPKRVFNKAARQALKKWKYKAKSVDGKAVVQQGLTVQLDFNMEQSS